MANPSTQFPAANILTDQYPYPFSALAQLIRNLIASIFGAGSSTVVWRPGGVSSGNVFATWPEVVAAVAILNGAITIGIDTDLAPAVIDAGAYDLRPAGVSGPVTFVSASKAPPFAVPFVTLGPGAVTIKGLSGLDNVSIDNQSTVPVIAVTANGQFQMAGAGAIFQEAGAGPFWAITGGDYTIFIKDETSVTTPGGGTPAVTVTAPGILDIVIADLGAFDTNMLTALAGVTVTVAPAARYLPQAGAPTIIPLVQRQVGSTAIVVGTGKTAAIPVFLQPTSKILVSLKTPVGDALTIKYAALAADRAPGAPGSFKISALSAAGGGAINGVDVSTIDWEVIAP